jgi:hypothetical protein
MGQSDIMAMGINLTQPVIRASSWVTIGSLKTSTLLNPRECMHDSLINFNGIYIGQRERVKISEIRMKQSAATLGTGESIVTNEMILVLFNTDAFTPVGGNQIIFPTGYDEDDILCAIKIPSTAWTTYKTGYAEALVQPNIIVEGNIDDANLGVNIHGILLANLASTLPAADVIKIQLKTELTGNADDD